MNEQKDVPVSNDFFENILRLIDEDQLQSAIDTVLDIDNERKIVEILIRLANKLQGILWEALTSHDDLVSNRIAFSNHALLDSLAGQYTSDNITKESLDRAVINARKLSGDIIHAIANDRLQDIQKPSRIHRLILAVLEEIQSRKSTLTFESIDLTPITLDTIIAPILNALMAIQTITGESYGRVSPEPRMRNLNAETVTIEISNLGTALDIINFFRKYPETKTKSIAIYNKQQELLTRQKQVEIDSITEQLKIQNDLSTKERKRQSKLDKLHAQREKQLLDLRKQEFELERESSDLLNDYRELAQKGLVGHFPEDMPQVKRLEYIARIIPHLRTILSREVNISMGFYTSR